MLSPLGVCHEPVRVPADRTRAVRALRHLGLPCPLRILSPDRRGGRGESDWLYCPPQAASNAQRSGNDATTKRQRNRIETATKPQQNRNEAASRDTARG